MFNIADKLNVRQRPQSDQEQSKARSGRERALEDLHKLLRAEFGYPRLARDLKTLEISSEGEILALVKKLIDISPKNYPAYFTGMVKKKRHEKSQKKL